MTPISGIEKKFCEIYADTGVPYVSSTDCLAIMGKINSESEIIRKQLNLDPGTIEKIDPDIVESLLKKGINPTALETVISSVSLLVEEGLGLWDGKKKITVVEIGTGAGWSTLILYSVLKGRFGDNFVILSIENSLLSLTCTKLLLSNQGIPNQIMSANLNEDISAALNMSGKVLLVKDTYMNVVSKLAPSSVAGFFSSNGFSYVDRRESKILLSRCSEVLTSGGSIVSDSLNPDYVMALEERFLKKHVFLGGNVNYISKNPTKSKIIVKNNIITEILTQSSCRFLDFLHYLFFRDQKEFQFYTEALESSLKIQRLLHNWVQNRSRDISALAKYGMLKECNLAEMDLPDYYLERFQFEHFYTEVVWLIKNI